MSPIAPLLALASFLFAKAPLVAVNELSSRGVSSNDASIITDRLRSELHQTGRLRIMERSEMDEVLREQAFQQSGACEQSECAVQIGKLLVVDRMAVGTVGKIGELYTLSLRLLDVQTGEVLYTANEDFEGRLEGLLTQAVPKIALKLANGASNSAAKGTTGTGRSELFVTTQDPDARLSIDGAPVDGKSPFSIERLEAGSHVLVAQGEVLYGTLTVNIGVDDMQKVIVPMTEMVASAKFISEPQGARVLVDGVENLFGSDATPFKIDGLPPGAHTFTFRKAGYFDTAVSAEIMLGKVQTIRVTMIQASTLLLRSNGTANARVIQGRDSISVDANGSELALREGKWIVKVDDYRWEPEQQEVELVPGKRSQVWFNLKARPLTYLKVLADQPAAIHLDGVLIGKTRPDIETQAQIGSKSASEWQVWRSDTLIAGLHKLLVTSDRRAPWQKDVTLEKGKTTPFIVQFKWSKEELDRRSRATHLAWRVGLGIGTVLAAGMSGYFQYNTMQFNEKANQAYADYKAARTNLSSYKTRYQSAQNSAKSNSNAADIGWIATSAFAAGLGLTWVF